MKKVLFIILISVLFFGCKSKKSLSVVDTKTSIQITSSNDTTIKIKERIIEQDTVKFKNDIKLNDVEKFKEKYNESNPLVSIDKATGAVIESFIDASNTLKQIISIKPKNINVSDTTTTIKNVKEKDTIVEKKEIITQPKKEPNFFERVWITIKGIYNLIIIFLIIIAIIYLNKTFNIIGLIKNLFK